MARSSTRFWILAGLLSANLLVGVLSLYFIRSVNQRYAELFASGVPVIYNLRTFTREVNAVQRLARRITSPESEPNPIDLIPQIELARDRIAARARDVAKFPIFNGTTHPAAIVEMDGEYAGHVQHFLGLVRAGRLAEASAYNLDWVRPCHDRYQQALDLAADFVEAQGRNLRARYEKDSRFFGGVSLVFASVPLAVVAVGALVMTVLIGMLLLAIFLPRPDYRR